MGVIYVVREAARLGFVNGDPDWCNLGQGQPEVGSLPGAPERVEGVRLLPQDHAYGPVGGGVKLREAIAAHYNRLYRTGHRSKYKAENVSVASGGRLVLSRLLAALEPGRVGFQTPDYSAYEDLLAYHAHRVTPVRLTISLEDTLPIPALRLRALCAENQLGAVLLSNPCNPTGDVIQGEELQSYVRFACQSGCALLLDEFYSHFIYEAD